jgi:hypothetical protein
MPTFDREICGLEAMGAGGNGYSTPTTVRNSAQSARGGEFNAVSKPYVYARLLSRVLTFVNGTS